MRLFESSRYMALGRLQRLPDDILGHVLLANLADKVSGGGGDGRTRIHLPLNHD